MFKLMGRKIITILLIKSSLNMTYNKAMSHETSLIKLSSLNLSLNLKILSTANIWCYYKGRVYHYMNEALYFCSDRQDRNLKIRQED